MTKRSSPEKPSPLRGIDDEKEGSPLGRGADPGTSVEGGPLRAQGIAGPRGGAIPGEKGGADGTLHRENEDAAQASRSQD